MKDFFIVILVILVLVLLFGDELMDLEPPTTTADYVQDVNYEQDVEWVQDVVVFAPAEPTKKAEPVVHVVVDAAGNECGEIGLIYDDGTIVVGSHGDSYGHLAIDIHAGIGATVKSPIAGTVTRLYLNEFGDVEIDIENECLKAELFHSEWHVVLGQQLVMGEAIGSESSNGGIGTGIYGSFTHWNVKNRQTGKNVNLNQMFYP